MEIRVGFIGAGNMASAIIRGISGSEIACRIYAYDTDESKTAALGNIVSPCKSLAELFNYSDYIFFAVKPQSLEAVFSSILDEVMDDLSSKVFVTMAAGISSAYFHSGLKNEKLKVVRIMPNTPMMLSAGATALCATATVDAEQRQNVRKLLECCSIVCEIPEEQMNAVISINGSSPAYIFLFAKAVIDYATACGIDPKCALELFSQTLIGSSLMLTSSGKNADELIKMVTSPGGTTLAAMQVFEQQHFTQIIQQAMSACTKRAEELGK